MEQQHGGRKRRGTKRGPRGRRVFLINHLDLDFHDEIDFYRTVIINDRAQANKGLESDQQSVGEERKNKGRKGKDSS